MSKIVLTSLGLKHRPKENADLPGVYMIDCRSLKNPFHVPALKAKTGKSADVQAYITNSVQWVHLFTEAKALMHKNDCAGIVAYCIGGRHRSVTMIEKLKGYAIEQGMPVQVQHLELD